MLLDSAIGVSINIILPWIMVQLPINTIIIV